MDRTEATAVAHRLYDALATGDRSAIIDLLHPTFEGHTAEGLPLGLGGHFTGSVEMLRMFWGAIARHYEARAVVRESRMLDDGRLLVTGTYVGSARSTGRPLSAEFTHILQFTEGRISWLDQLTDTHAWHAALQGRNDADTVEFTVADNVATICLNRPDQRNAINQRMADELLDVALRCAENEQIRAVLLCGNGPAFTVGGDIDYFTAHDGRGYGALFRTMTSPFHEAFRILDRLDAPIVVAVHGSVAGGGLGFLYAADIAYAAPETKFATAFAGIGLSGDGGGTWYLPRLVGPRRAAQMYLENRVIDARTAAEWGLVTEIVPLDEVRERAHAKAVTLAAGPTKAFGRMRAMLRSSWSNTLSEQFVEEAENVAFTGSTEDAANAIESFAAKRKPLFQGR